MERKIVEPKERIDLLFPKKPPDDEEKRKLKRQSRRALAGLFLLISLPFLIGIISLIKEYNENHLTSFKEKDIDRIEQIFDIDVTEDIRLCSFEFEARFPDESDAYLELITADYEKFIKNNIKSPVIIQNEGEIVYGYNKNTIKITTTDGGDYRIKLECHES